jgi:hypothetical protein
VRMIRAKEFAFRNSHQRKIERMSLGKVERLRLAPEGNRDILRCPPKFSLWRLSFLLWDVFEIHFAHVNNFLSTRISNPRFSRYLENLELIGDTAEGARLGRRSDAIFL